MTLLHYGDFRPARSFNTAASFHISPALPADFDALRTLYEGFFTPGLDFIPDDFTLSLLIRRKWIHLTKEGRKIVGFIAFRKDDPDWDYSRDPYRKIWPVRLLNWWVAPGYRGVGIGSGLFDQFLLAAKGTTCQRCELPEEHPCFERTAPILDRYWSHSSRIPYREYLRSLTHSSRLNLPDPWF